MKIPRLLRPARAAQRSEAREVCRITPLARTQSERRRRLALATGFRLLRLSGINRIAAQGSVAGRGWAGGKAERIWLMDRGIPTEEVLQEMRHSNPPIKYLVGTPRGRLTRLENQLLDKPWHSARPGVKVKLLAQQRDLYVLAESHDRIAKERSMRRRRVKWLWARLTSNSAP